jgi:hypothetical protein
MSSRAVYFLFVSYDHNSLLKSEKFSGVASLFLDIQTHEPTIVSETIRVGGGEGGGETLKDVTSLHVFYADNVL